MSYSRLLEAQYSLYRSYYAVGLVLMFLVYETVIPHRILYRSD
jgi:hypothetical protein